MKQVLLGLFILISVFARAQQNLVPNPSFEEYIFCPTGQDELNEASPWFKPTIGTSDYYNMCASIVSGYDVPSNWGGFQNARTGNAYAGLGAIYNNLNNNNREYIAIKLSEPLKKNYRYTIQYYTSLTNNSQIGTDAMGAFIGDSIVDFTDHILLNVIAQINNPKGNVLKDTINWMKVSGIIKSEGGERFLIIGNFTDHAQSVNDTINGPCTDCFAYYYIDDVSVVCLNCDSTAPENNLFIPDAFSPNGDGNNDVLFVRGNNIKTMHIAVYDRWGEIVFESNDQSVGWDGTYKGKELNSGVFVYYCTWKYLDNGEFRQKGDITLVR